MLDTHHAIGLLSASKEDVLLALSKKGVALNSPDVLLIEQAQWGIDESRTLAQYAMRGPLMDPILYIVAVIGRISVEAQNALLKTLEEPGSRVRIILCLDESVNLLDTVRSRLLITQLPPALGHAKKSPVPQSLAERRLLIDSILKEKDAVKAREAIRTLIDGIPASPKNAEARARLLKLLDYSADRSPSLKMLLERAMLQGSF